MKLLPSLLASALLLPLAATAADPPIAEVYGDKVYTRDPALPASFVEENKAKLSTTEFAHWQQDACVD